MFGSLFKGPRFLDADLEDWHLETWAWLMRHRGGMGLVRQTPLVLPSRDYFPPSEAAGEARAEHVFSCVRELMGMQNWPCRLEARERASTARVGEFWALQSTGQAGGTFQVVNGEAIICYARELVDKPAQLVATFAHELSHFLLCTVEEPPPGGEAGHELATELCVAYRGLAVFSANTAFTFEQHGDTFSQGWRSQRSGYFSPRGWAFALATFLELKAAPAEEGLKHLKPEIADMMKAARRYLAKRPEKLAPLLALT
ncbi:hypothetical protein [Phenylobacterium montanum]|uniref:Uncharacterized protein n=1 Tax=Phenylobacterium montanum TaxID=2823693 RepID=A0A975FWH0_9CAUL|nr:hypothetical protein [Caulobacter sp. S6]QUD86675.1 hypothetical protein KCG34_16530 [Caulobacter sp. S6]